MKRAIITATAVAATILGVSACTSSTPSNPQSQGQKQTIDAYGRQSAAVPYPADQLNNSIERQNLREKLLRYNNPSKISYIYLLSQTGGIYAYFTVKGKVSSNSSQMTTDQLIISKCHSGDGCNDVTVDAPGDDGSYGPNEPGIFFFTTDNVMVTWDGPYLLTDAPMKIDPAKVTLNYIPGSKPSSTGGK